MLNAGQKYFCNASTFIKLQYVFKTFVLSIFEWELRQFYCIVFHEPSQRGDIAFDLSVSVLTISLLSNFSCFVVCCLFFSKSTFKINSFRNTIRVSNSFDPDQAQYFVGPDMGPNFLQK